MGVRKKHKIVFIPGTACDERLWERLWPLLNQQFELQHLAIPRGDDIGQIVASLSPEFNKKTVNLLGFSLGGYLASSLSLAYPLCVRKLMLVGSSPSRLSEHEVAERSRVIAWIKRYGYSGIQRRRIKAYLHGQHQNHSSIIDIIKAMDAGFGQHALLEQLSITVNRKDLSASLMAAAIPTFFCYGDHDKLVNRALIQALCMDSDLFNLKQITGAGHMLPLEQPEKLAQCIEQWMF
jgi:pimeloyl-ACP methyl ester carboxylesterase